MRKPLPPPDQHLWDEVTKSIKPLRATAKRSKLQTASRLGVLHNQNLEVTPRPSTRSKPQSERAQHNRKLHAKPPPLAHFDRRTAQRLSRGQIEPDTRIDLHGSSVELARHRLLQFLSAERQQGARVALVITGKGASPFARHTLHGYVHFNAPEREGKLRRELPRWLSEEVFRMHVVGYQPAHPRHGGGGAFYVKLRRVQEDAVE